MALRPWSRASSGFPSQVWRIINSRRTLASRLGYRFGDRQRRFHLFPSLVGGERSEVQGFRARNSQERSLHLLERRIVDEFFGVVHAEKHEGDLGDLT